MSKNKKILMWFVIVAVLTIGGYFIFGSKKQDTVYTTAVAEKGTLSQTVSSTGDVTDSKEIILNFEISGKIGKIFVEEGQSVAVGEKIATISNPVLETEVERAKANLDGVIAKSSGNNDAVREAEVLVENSEDTLEDTEDLNDENITAAEQAKDDAQDYLNDAQAYYNTILADNGNDETDAAVRSAKLTLTTAQKSYNAASDAVEVAKKQAELSETGAENNLNSAESRLETLKSEYTQDSNDSSVASARASYEIAVENLAKATLLSSVNGIITKINNKEGEVLGTGVVKESFTKVLANDLIIESNISESDIVKVVLGDKAKVTFDAFNSDDEFSAEIVQIDTDATVIQDVVYYRTKLRLDNVDRRLKPGMSANVDIATAEKNNVVMVPSRAIKTEDDKKYVEVLKEDNTTEKVYVETGLEGDEGMVEITSGLEGGENVVTFVQEEK